MKLLLLITLVFVAGLLLWRLWRAFALLQAPASFPDEAPLPSVSVCIPARNEIHALAICLERVLASTYEKLEILVYDDSSADETSVLIKSFAHEGVRFVPGVDLPEGWLGKNHALEVLAREASGGIIIFMDIDTHVEPDTLSKLVATFQARKTEMISVLPLRRDNWRGSVIFGTLRYFWQLVAPGFHYPATSSALWMIRRSVLLEKFDGLSLFKSSVEPEAHIARRLENRYAAFISGSILGVGFEKKWSSQCETSKRLLYPQFGGRWWSVPLGIFMFGILNAPTLVVLDGIFRWAMFHTLAVVILIVFMLLYGTYLTRMWTRGWWLGALLWPYVIFQEFILFILSVYGYWGGTITWKGRSVAAAKSVSSHES